MGKFDLVTFLELAGRGRGVVNSIQTTFGMPSCLVNLGDDILNILPAPILRNLRGSTGAAITAADDVVKAAFAKLRWINGIIEFDTEEGVFKFISDTSKGGIDRNEGGLLNALGGFLGAVNSAPAFAGRLYRNYTTARAQLNGIKECFEVYNEYLKYSGGNAAEKKSELANVDPQAFRDLMDRDFGIEKEQVESAVDFIDRASTLIGKIDTILGQRANNPDLEPEFDPDLEIFVSGVGFRIGSEEDQEEEGKEIFRLQFGPPKTREGQFILTSDGLYYDSQVSGVVPALMELDRRTGELDLANRWKLEHDPNVGGRGKSFGINELNLYVNTILDPNVIDESTFMQQYYDADNFLQTLEGQRNKRIFDLSAHIAEMENNTVISVAFKENQKQQILSENAHFQEKINKRKKQIELAVKMPSIYSGRTSYSIGNIPLNDFSYLEGINFNLDIQRQKAFVLDQVEISGVVRPLSSTFVVPAEHTPDVVLDHLLLTNLGTGSIIFDASTASSTAGTTLAATPAIAEDRLFALYNFLDTYVELPSSTSYVLDNGATENHYNDAMLAAYNSSSVFDRGLGIARLNGITMHHETDPTIPSAVGSFVRCPDTPEFNDFLYNRTGATFETWVHLPDFDNQDWGFGDGNASGLTRVILGNENVGIHGAVTATGNINRQDPNFSPEIVRGMVFGYTTDRRITQDLDPNNDQGLNFPTDMHLFLAPVQSYDSSSATFINKGKYLNNQCASSTIWHSMKVHVSSLNANGVAPSAAGLTFIQLALAFDPQVDQIRMYLDGELFRTSAISEVFGTRKYSMPNIPTFYKSNSFRYVTSGVSTSAPEELRTGPLLNDYFTPWIVGGGFTDGYQSGGNFMGGEFGGQRSGLQGYVGSVKFYSKALSNGEVKKNFDAQKTFFKNIDLPNEIWEPVLQGS